MTQDEIIEMARQAHRKLVTEVYIGHMGQLDPWTIELLKIFAKLIATKVRKSTLEEMIFSHPTTTIKKAVEYERDACAKICIDLAADYISKTHPANEIAAKVLAIGATQIRARGEA